jgi:NAD(P)-dependent dehydrogenase (short-subunit alcohol dehydrogenase family)
MDTRRVIVTGASSGIGRATAQRFAKEGWDVFLTALDEDGLNKVRLELPEGHHLVYVGPYEDPRTAAEMATLLSTEWGTVDVLINCAGVFSSASIVDATLEEWREPFDVMMNGALHMTRLAVSLMTSGGRIVHVTSIHGERAEKGSSGYAVAKAALNQYCRGLALELAPRNILVNAIAPGFVDTPMNLTNGVNELTTVWFRENYVSGHHLPLKRAAQPKEIAGVAYFLAGPDASYLTGQVITVDGGLTITF